MEVPRCSSVNCGRGRSTLRLSPALSGLVSIPLRGTPLRVVLNRVGEATLAQYAVARDPMDSPEVACQFWREVVAVDPCHEPDKEHLVAVLLNAKFRMIGYHVVSVGSLNEALAHPREIFRAAILA